MVTITTTIAPIPNSNSSPKFDLNYSKTLWVSGQVLALQELVPPPFPNTNAKHFNQCWWQPKLCDFTHTKLPFPSIECRQVFTKTSRILRPDEFLLSHLRIVRLCIWRDRTWKPAWWIEHCSIEECITCSWSKSCWGCEGTRHRLRWSLILLSSPQSRWSDIT